MRIVLVFSHNVSLETWASAGILNREVSIYRRIAEEGVEVVFVTYGDEKDYDWQNMWRGISIVPLFAGRKKFRSKAFLWLHSLLLAYRVRLVIPHPDLIKTNQIVGGLVAVQMKIMWSEPLLVRCGYDPYQFALKGRLNSMKSLLIHWYSFIVYRSADRIHVASEQDAKFVRRHYALKKNCDIEVRPNWVDTALFKLPIGRNVEPMRDRVLAIGRAVDQKNFQLMIEAIGLGPYGIDIISDDDGPISLEEITKQFSADVRLLARVPHQELPALYCSYPVYLITSRFEGHPKTLLEAMACGRAVVGTRVPGIEQVIDDEQTGLLVEETPALVQEAIHRLMSDATLREQLGRAAREEVRQKYSLDDAVREELDAYRNLVGRDIR